MLGYAADNALTFAAGAVAGPRGADRRLHDQRARTVLGDRLLAQAWLVSAGQRLIVTRCELIEPHPDGGRLSAIAQGTIARTS